MVHMPQLIHRQPLTTGIGFLQYNAKTELLLYTGFWPATLHLFAKSDDRHLDTAVIAAAPKRILRRVDLLGVTECLHVPQVYRGAFHFATGIDVRKAAPPRTTAAVRATCRKRL